MTTNLDTCGVRFTTVQCECEDCTTCFDVDADHPLWPDGPFLCHEHEHEDVCRPLATATVLRSIAEALSAKRPRP